MNAHVQNDFRKTVLLDLANQIEPMSAFRFNMSNWTDCIAGHCARVYQAEPIDASGIRVFAKQFLGLTESEWPVLFMPTPGDLGIDIGTRGNVMEIVTAKWAANVLRMLAFTGKVDWKAARPEGMKLLIEVAAPMQITGMAQFDDLLPAFGEGRELCHVD